MKMSVSFTNKQIDDVTLAFLKNSSPRNNFVPKIEESMTRDQYKRFNDVLESLGGKWSRKLKGHVFADDIEVAELIDLVVETGCYPENNPYSFFPTPAGVASQMAEIALGHVDLWTDAFDDGIDMLEPSAGSGMLVYAAIDKFKDRLKSIKMCEIEPDKVQKLYSKYSDRSDVQIINGDYLSTNLKNKYNVVIMNPPFSCKGNPAVWADHVSKAYSELRSHGVLVSIVPASFKFGINKKIVALRDMIGARYAMFDLPVDTFKNSGAMVNTLIIRVGK